MKQPHWERQHVRIRAKRPISHAGQRHDPGDVLEVLEELAKHLIASGDAEPADEGDGE